MNWMGSTIWNTDFTIRKKGLENAIEALSKINKGVSDIDINHLCADELNIR